MCLFLAPQGRIVMLYTQTVEAGTLDLIKELIKDEELDSFNLVGCTALSLKLDHRISVYIYLFTDRNFNSLYLSRHLAQTYNTGDIKTLKNGIFCFINGIKVHTDGKLKIIKSLKEPSPLKLYLEKLSCQRKISGLAMQALEESGRDAVNTEIIIHKCLKNIF
jgi:hypothetical protein